MPFEVFWFKPLHQPNEAEPVSFELRPFNMEALDRVRRSLKRDREPSWVDMAAALNKNVTNWKGVEAACTPENRAAILSGEASTDWINWLQEIVAELCVHSHPGDAERKNS